MRLYLIRHAPAATRRPGVPDDARALTPRGRARFARAVRGLRRLGVRLDDILHSPKRRAIETAALLAPLSRGRMRTCDALARPPAPALLAELRGKSVALVGHEPWMSELVAWLVAGDRKLAARLTMKKGAVVVLDGAARPGSMRLLAALPPKVLRRLAGV